jgi:uncharacterized protein
VLELRPNCEGCDKDLPPSSMEANICSFECTFCTECVENLLHNVCPNCGGGFSSRPVRPKGEYRSGVCLATRPASIKRVNTSYSKSEIEAFVRTVEKISPEDR